MSESGERKAEPKRLDDDGEQLVVVSLRGSPERQPILKLGHWGSHELQHQDGRGRRVCGGQALDGKGGFVKTRTEILVLVPSAVFLKPDTKILVSRYLLHLHGPNVILRDCDKVRLVVEAYNLRFVLGEDDLPIRSPFSHLIQRTLQICMSHYTGSGRVNCYVVRIQEA
jgi:hypothetical protein